MPYVVDWLMAEYGIPLREAVWSFPLAAASALARPRTERRGGQWRAPDSADRRAAAARARAKAWLREHFQILPPGEPGPADALGEWLRAQSGAGGGGVPATLAGEVEPGEDDAR